MAKAVNEVEPVLDDTVTRPRQVAINEVLIRPTEQERWIAGAAISLCASGCRPARPLTD